MIAYCDFIAHKIKEAFNNDKPDNLIESVDAIKWDLHPEEGYMLSTDKSIQMTDFNGKKYLVTVTEL